MKKRNISILALTLAFTMVGFSGCGKKNAEVEDSRIPIETTKIVTGDLSEYYSVSGVAKAISQASITPKTPGKITGVNAQLGDKVSAGKLLCTLDKSDISQSIKALDAQIEQAHAGIESASIGAKKASGSGYEQAVMQAQTAVDQAKNGLSQAKSSLAQLEIEYSLEETNYNNMKTLYEGGNISKVSFEGAEAKFKAKKEALEAVKNSCNAAQVTYDNAVKSLELTKSSASDTVKTANANVNSASASKKVLQAQKDNAAAKLADMDIKTPISGVIVEKHANIGEMASQQVPLFVVADISKINFEINIPESMINNIQKGQSVKIVVSSISKEFDAVVKNVAPSVTGQSTGYIAIVEVNNTDSELKPGMTGSINFLLNQKPQVVYAPLDSIITEDEKHFVFVYSDDKVKKIAIEIGIKDGNKVEILNGLFAGDTIVSKGQHNLTDEIAVRVVKEN